MSVLWWNWKRETTGTSWLKLTWIFPKLIFVKDITTLGQHLLLSYEPSSRLSPPVSLTKWPKSLAAIPYLYVEEQTRQREWKTPQPLVEKLCKKVRGGGWESGDDDKEGITVPQTLTSSLPPSQFLTTSFDSAWLVASCRGWRFAPSLRRRRRRSRWLVRYTVSCGVLMLNPECRMYTLPGFVVSGKDKVDHIYTRFKGVAK